MRVLTRNPAIAVLIVLNLLVATFYLGVMAFHRWKSARMAAASDQISTSELAERLERHGIQTKKDFYAGRALLKSTWKSGTLSHDAELWVTEQLRKTGGGGGELLDVEMIVDEVKTLTPEQKVRLFDVCSSVLTSPGTGSAASWRKQIACHLLGMIGDRRAVPLLLPFLQGKPDRTHRFAREALKTLGYTETAAQP